MIYSFPLVQSLFWSLQALSRDKLGIPERLLLELAQVLSVPRLLSSSGSLSPFALELLQLQKIGVITT